MTKVATAPVRIALYLAVAIGPWLVLAWQEGIRYTDASGSIWPATTIVAGFFLLGLLLLQRHWGREEASAAPGDRLPWRQAVAAVAMAGGALHFLAELRRICRMLWLNPITPTQADMLPLIQCALRTFARDHESPYRYHEVASWGMHLTFTPGLWLPFSIPYAMGLDIRLWTAIALALTSMALVTKAALQVMGSRSPLQATAAIPALVAAVLLTHIHHLKIFTPAMHVAGMWLALAAWGLAVAMRRQFAAGFFLGFAIISRPYMAFMLPFYLVHCGVNLRRSPRAVLAQWLGMSIPAAIALAFLLHDPHAYFYGPVTAYDAQLVPHVMRDALMSHGFGFSAVLREWNLLGWRMPLTLASQALLLALSFRLLKRPNDMILAVTVSIFLVMAFAVIPWHYVFIDVLVLLAVWSPSGEALPVGPSRARSLALPALLVFGLLVAGTVAREVARPPVRVPREESPGLRELAKLRLSIAGFDYNGWAPNDGSMLRKMVDANCYAGFPVYRLDGTALEVEVENRSDAEFSLRLLLNTQLLGVYTVPPGRQTVRAAVPAGTFFRGLDTLRLERLDNPPGEFFLARITPIQWTPASPP